MNSFPYWHKLPGDLIREQLPLFRWQPEGQDGPATATAALMLYVALIFHTKSNEMPTSLMLEIPTAEVSYSELQESTGLSRKLIAGGIRRLEASGLVKRTGNAQKRCYVIRYGNSFSKIPCRPIVRGNRIHPFHQFSLRSKHELYALKLYLYLLSVRPNEQRYAQASYEKIYKKTGVPERDIQRAIAHLINVRLLQTVKRAEGQAYGPNEYHFYGADLFFTSSYIREAAEDGGRQQGLADLL
ncbi:hypothetical protein FX016_22920 [Cupriavidus gilardii]|nr:hypothetical protein FX016_22920 [Cupriavidus gilardii]